jgi:Protein of unknown function (DUF2716)
VTDDPLERLRDSESRKVWDQFDAKFTLCPSIETFPAITEPVESITWSLDGPDQRLDELKIDCLNMLIYNILAACALPGSSPLILEWRTLATVCAPTYLPQTCSCPKRSPDTCRLDGRKAPTRTATTP